MKWINVNSVEELKELGNFNTVKKEIKQDLLDKANISGRGWEELYSNIVQFKFLIESINKIMDDENNNNMYFSSNASEYIYYLLELNEELKKEKLEINKSHYTNKKKAKAWRDNIFKTINTNQHPKSEDALNELNKIYELMIKRI